MTAGQGWVWNMVQQIRTQDRLNIQPPYLIDRAIKGCRVKGAGVEVK